MTDRIDTRPRQTANTVDRSIILRKAMEVLSVKGFAKASMADLAGAVGVGPSVLRKAFGTRDQILREAIQFCAETEASLAQEPLRASSSGREAILSLLEENVRLHRYWPRHCDCLFALNAFVVPPEDPALQELLSENRRSVSKQIRSRLIQSITEGELSGGTNCEALANVCFTFLSGLAVRVWDGAPPGILFQSIELFVNGLGFRPRRAKSRVPRSRKRRGKERQ
jgi:AcrR family transcriptional regulator